MRPHTLLAIAVIAATLACSSDRTTSVPVFQRPDTTHASGPAIVTIAGTVLAPDPNTDANSEVMLIVSGTDPIPLLGNIDLLRQVGGTEILAYGYTGANGFQVVEFEVKGANGMSAWDGYLESGDDGLALRLRDGSMHTIASPPDELAALIGSRVWVAEAPDSTAAAFGVILKVYLYPCRAQQNRAVRLGSAPGCRPDSKATPVR